jgi:hypothetical protein
VFDGGAASWPPEIKNRVRIARRRSKGARTLEALRRGTAADDEDDASVPKRRVPGRAPGEPVEVQALVSPTECVKGVAHPDSPPGQCDLLREDAVSQDRRSVGAL